MDAIRVENVACMSKESNNIPSEFIRPETEQPGITTVQGVNLEVPTIDFNQQEDQVLMDQIMEASRDWGMYQIVNHGIPSDVIANLQAVGKAFFDLPQQQKELIAKLPGSVEGYGTLLQKDIQIEGKKGWVDHLFHRVWPPSAINYRFWPTHPPSYREANEEYVKQLHGVIDKLLKSIGKGIGMEGHEVRDALGGEKLEYLMKINYYPPCPRPDLVLGVPAHTDMSAITILVPNHVQGLQAYRDGHWYDVKYIPNALVIHIGDQLEILSNGKYKAVLHRTTVCDETRMSWPLFLEPPANQMVGPHPKLIDDQNPPKFKTKTFADFAYCKFNKISQ